MGGLWLYPRKWGWETLGCLTWAEERPGGEPGWRKLQKDWGWGVEGGLEAAETEAGVEQRRSVPSG